MNGCSTNWGAYVTSLKSGAEDQGFNPPAARSAAGTKTINTGPNTDTHALGQEGTDLPLHPHQVGVWAPLGGGSVVAQSASLQTLLRGHRTRPDRSPA
jgi:hypothetical protein